MEEVWTTRPKVFLDIRYSSQRSSTAIHRLDSSFTAGLKTSHFQRSERQQYLPTIFKKMRLLLTRKTSIAQAQISDLSRSNLPYRSFHKLKYLRLNLFKMLKATER